VRDGTVAEITVRLNEREARALVQRGFTGQRRGGVTISWGYGVRMSKPRLSIETKLIEAVREVYPDAVPDWPPRVEGGAG
jgi:hypothetical protein